MTKVLIRLIIATLMVTGTAAAQSFAPGVKGGFNLASQYGEDVRNNTSLISGFTGGFFLRFSLSEAFDIQPEVLYTQKGFDYEYSLLNTESIDKTRHHYLEIPLQFLIHIPAGSTLAPYISVGPYGAILIESKNVLYQDDEKIATRVITDNFRRADFGISAGFGSQFPLAEGDIILDFRFNAGLLSIASSSYTDVDTKNISFAMTLGYAFKVPMLMGHRSENVQQADASYIRFTGTISNILIEVDGGPQFTVESASTNYETTPGKHVVKAYRGNQLILHRELFIGNHETKEVKVQ